MKLHWRRFFSVKERPTFDPLIIHVASDDLSELVDYSKLSDLAKTHAEKLMKKFWPGPLTIVFPKAKKVPDLATSGLDTVAIRMPRHQVALELIKAVGSPLAAPSANRFGRISPTTAAAVYSELGDRIPLILEGGNCEVGLESTVVHLAEDGTLTLLRPGGTPREAIDECLGIKTTLPAKDANVSSPGMLASHYAPRKPFFVMPARLEDLGAPSRKSELIRFIFETAIKHKSQANAIKLGFLCIRGDSEWNKQMLSQVLRETFERAGVAATLEFTSTLAAKGDLTEAAKNFFAEMRSLDESTAEILFSEPCFDPRGLGFAIQDRLKRASHKT